MKFATSQAPYDCMQGKSDRWLTSYVRREWQYGEKKVGRPTDDQRLSARGDLMSTSRRNFHGDSMKKRRRPTGYNIADTRLPEHHLNALGPKKTDGLATAAPFNAGRTSNFGNNRPAKFPV